MVLLAHLCSAKEHIHRCKESTRIEAFELALAQLARICILSIG